MRKTLALVFLLFSFNTFASKDSKQINCLAKAIYFEARGEDWKGMVAVAQVAKNRTESDNFPDTFCKVVYQKNQFSWAKYNPKVKDKDSWDQALAVAKVAYYLGFPQDVTRGALYFHSGNHKPSWTSRLKKSATINNHKFYKEKHSGK